MFNQTHRRTLGLVSVLALATVAGCGRNVAYNDKVEGTVLYNGAPLANVRLQFAPQVEAGIKAIPSTAMTDAAGHYHLDLESGKPGAAVATHAVVVVVGRDYDPATDGNNHGSPATASPRVQIPACYREQLYTPLLVEVTADKHAYDLALSSNAQPRPAKSSP
jgi:hypothetical protein